MTAPNGEELLAKMVDRVNPWGVVQIGVVRADILAISAAMKAKDSEIERLKAVLREHDELLHADLLARQALNGGEADD